MKLFIALGLLTCSFINPALALVLNVKSETTEPLKKSVIEVQSPYAFATLPGATTGAAFMLIENAGELDDTLIGARSKIAEITEIHQNIIDPDDGKMMMRKVKNIALPMGEQVTLEPKGYHIMFIKMKDALAINTNTEVTLIFEKAGEVKVSLPVVAPGIKPKQKKVMPWDTSKDVEVEDNAQDEPEVLEERTDY